MTACGRTINAAKASGPSQQELRAVFPSLVHPTGWWFDPQLVVRAGMYQSQY